MPGIIKVLLLLVGLSLGACTSMPIGPSLLVLPGSGRTFEQFQMDDYSCRQFALGQIGGHAPNQAAISSGLGSAATGAALGAAAGAAINGGAGAAVGAGGGLVAGSVAGTETADVSGYLAQQRYDIGYVQCMYAKGHRVPVYGQFTNDAVQNSQSGMNIPPPPPGTPPPPPH